ncbi:autotransporter outer membrane beta-barrel domain-containing protein [Erythrobacter sp. F6033]|uniref:autotransporter outer membrane beta-barrel domain-containing protein n=1 Tax=Erythrobacter sp. F6033 TaxID=2926401 RepID=UPI001FF6E29A|nr:autotransporter outer membrane beta-barrel domain-containing protein [Erythrobacter sp. F6033]MCK0127597.1 autotransporter domain-containing protein [Erythrobacter sp. F6033]
MNNPRNRKTALTTGRLLLTSSSLAILMAGSAQAQQVINDGDNATVTSAADGETISAAGGVTSTVDGAPVIVVANNAVTVDNAGTLATTGVTQTIQVNQGTTGAVINNAATGRLEAASRVVNFDGSDATLNNDGVILGTGSQRNGAVYGNRTSNNITINNSATGSIDAGVEGAGVAIEVGGGGAPRGGAINNAGTIQGRGQASPMGGTAGDGIRFFGPGLAPQYVYEGDITNSGLINSESTQGTVAGIRFANRIGFQGTLTNQADGVISGAQNGLYFGNDADHTGGVVNNLGTISSDSRALNIDGTGLVVNNLADARILGSDAQRNGTVYADSTAQDFVLNNAGGIDAVFEGAGFSAELSEAGNNFTINVEEGGFINGRGQAAAGAASAGDGLRFERTRVGGMLDGSTTGLFTGTINNAGQITSESTQGTTAGIRFVNGVSFQGTLNNEAGAVIAGVQNGLYFGNPTPAGGADHTGGVVNNAGFIQSDSRALNIDGTGLVVNNTGVIIGTDNQRNGTVYADSTAQNFELNNLENGLIDAGAGNEGAGFSVELASAADGGSTFNITNDGTIQGRGNAGAGLAAAGDGLRFERTRNMGALDGTSDGLFIGNIINSGTIDSEAANGTAAGIRFVNGVSFQGVLDNLGTISGIQNGLYFGNPTPAGGGDFTQAIVNNSGTISSGSRALNIDGNGLTVNNSGQIIGTGNQRNGTVYADSTAQNFELNNLEGGIIDAGEGNQGAGFSVELASAADGGSTFDITNDGTIQGRGTAAAGSTTAGDGLRFERTRNMGALDGTTNGLFIGDITNAGAIASEGDSGTTAGIRFVNGVSFTGTLTNSGTISGVQNGLYFGNPTPAGGGDFSNAIVNNSGIISSGSRALNIDGNGLTVSNSGSILGTGAQRNGTVYSDGTANAFTLNNTGTIDAVVQGSGVSLQLGATDGDARTFSLTNSGAINGRGDALSSGDSSGVRLFSSVNGVSASGDITNTGTIASETGAGLLIESVNFIGTVTNSGTIAGAVNAVDASDALGALTFVQNGGALNGNFVGSAFADTLTIGDTPFVLSGDVQGDVDVTTSADNILTVQNMRSIEGSLTANGALNFELGVDALAVDGDTVLGADSVVNIATSQIDQSQVGQTIDVLTETGTFTDNGTTVSLLDDDFLVDFTVNLGSVSVTLGATDLGAVSADANTNSFGAALTTAVANNRLPADVFADLNTLTSATEFEAASLALLPAINDGVTREIYETQRLASALVRNRLSGEESGLWGEVFYRTADRDASSVSNPGYDADAIGFTLGLDAKLGENTTVGALFNYSDINVDTDGVAGAQSSINAFQLGGYAGFDLDGAYVNAELGYSFNSVDNSRIALGSQILGESDVDGFYGSINAGYDIETGDLVITPNGGLRYAELSRGTFTETGGLGLTLDNDSAEFFEARAGLKVAGKAETGVIPFASIDYAYDLSSDPLAINASFNGGADTFQLVTDEASESRFDLGAGLDFVSENGLTIGAEYRGRFASGYQSHSGGVRIRFEF